MKNAINLNPNKNICWLITVIRRIVNYSKFKKKRNNKSD